MADQGRFCWYDLMTADTEAAVDFYGKVAGWGTQVWDGSGKAYTMWIVGEQPIGGVVPITEELAGQGVPPHWMSYVSVNDVDATNDKAVELGGSVLHPSTDIPQVGRFSVIADPQGASIALFTPETGMGGADQAPAKGHFSWHELMTTDWKAAFDFYRQLFGWEKTSAMDMGEMGTYQMYGNGGNLPLGGMFNKPPEAPMPCWLYYILVDDVNRVLEVVTDNGGQIAHGPIEVPGGDLVATCTDPQGAFFALHSRKA